MAKGTRSGPGYLTLLPSSARAAAAPSRAARARAVSGLVVPAVGMTMVPAVDVHIDVHTLAVAVDECHVQASALDGINTIDTDNMVPPRHKLLGASRLAG